MDEEDPSRGLAYASRLTPRREKGGGMGGREYFDPPEEVSKKIVYLSELLAAAKNCVVL